MSHTAASPTLDNFKQQLADLLKAAQQRGVTQAEAHIAQGKGQTTQVRLGEVETLEHRQSQSLSLTVYLGQCQGSASTQDFSPAALEATLEAAMNGARYTGADPAAGLAEAEHMAQHVPDLDLCHPWDINSEQAIALAHSCEHSAREADSRIQHSDGASVSTATGLYVYGNTHGFIDGWASSQHSIYCHVIAQANAEKQSGSWFSVARAADDLETVTDIGHTAAQRAVERLNARTVPTCQVPVIFNPQTATSLLSHLVSAIQGETLYRKASFLLDKLGQRIFPDNIHIDEQPHLNKALGSAPFDQEGVATQPRDLVCAGQLQSYILNSYTGRKLGLPTTGNAGGVHNLTIEATGNDELTDLVQQLERGLVVTHLMGMGVNLVTGDYSRGASGFWVEQGQIQYPVQEITIAGNLAEMFHNLQAIGTDTEMRGNLRTGSWLIEQMMVAGQ